MNRVVHFEIPAGNPERAIRFYSGVFGWEIDRWGGPADYWLARTGPDGTPGINGAISRMGAGNTRVVNTIGVPSVDAFLKKVVEHGGTMVAPKMAIPGVGYHALFSDTEGNLFGLMEEDKSAK